MSFFLVSLDGGSSVEVPLGRTVLGRGSFLQVMDRRVSRRHALLDNTDRGLSIKPTHVNPCFVPSLPGCSPLPLQRDCWFSLRSGDIFSLLPGRFVYRVELQLDGTSRNSPTLEAGPEDKAPPTAEPIRDHHRNTEASEDIFRIKAQPPKAAPRKRILPAWMNIAIAQSAVKRAGPVEEATPITSRVKVEPLMTREDGDTDEDVSVETSKPSSVQTHHYTACTAKTRIPCPYGTNCYRKNPVHFQDFSHPGDPDFEEEEEQPECPYGLQCYRKNPLHWKQFTHKTGRVSRPVVRVKRDEEDEDEDSGSDSDYVPQEEDSVFGRKRK